MGGEVLDGSQVQGGYLTSSVSCINTSIVGEEYSFSLYTRTIHRGHVPIYTLSKILSPEAEGPLGDHACYSAKGLDITPSQLSPTAFQVKKARTRAFTTYSKISLTSRLRPKRSTSRYRTEGFGESRGPTIFPNPLSQVASYRMSSPATLARQIDSLISSDNPQPAPQRPSRTGPSDSQRYSSTSTCQVLYSRAHHLEHKAQSQAAESSPRPIRRFP